MLQSKLVGFVKPHVSRWISPCFPQIFLHITCDLASNVTTYNACKVLQNHCFEVHSSALFPSKQFAAKITTSFLPWEKQNLWDVKRTCKLYMIQWSFCFKWNIQIALKKSWFGCRSELFFPYSASILHFSQHQVSFYRFPSLTCIIALTWNICPFQERRVLSEERLSAASSWDGSEHNLLTRYYFFFFLPRWL